MATPVLATTRYTEIGTYIGQFFLPGAGNLPDNIRVPCLVGKGDRNIVIPNALMRRSFVYNELLSFSAISPFLATTGHASDGTQASPTRLYTTSGVEVTANKWEWERDLSGNFKTVHIIDTAFDPLSQYYLDYQSTSRDVVDVVPEISIQNMTATAQIREIVSMGSIQNLQEYLEYRDFIIDFEIDQLVADVGNMYTSTGFTPVSVHSGVIGTGTVAVSSSAAYSHNYDRLYTFVVQSVDVAVAPHRSATLLWSSTPISLGNGALPATPLNPAQQSPAIVIEEGSLTNPLTNRLLELGVVVDFSFGTTNFVVGDTFTVQARGPSLIELDPLLANENQFTTISPIEVSNATGSTGSMVVSSSSTAYTLTNHNLNVRLECVSATGTTGAGNRVATFVWSGYGTTLVSGVFTVSQATPASFVQVLGATGITLTLSFGAVHFVVASRYDFQVKAPRIFYQGKEAVRNITFSVGAVNIATSGKAVVSGGYLADTAEGRFGSWLADTSVNQGRFDIPDALRFYARNAFISPAMSSATVPTVSDLPVSPSHIGLVNLVASSGVYYIWSGTAWMPMTSSRLTAGDDFTTQCRSLGTIDFSLETETTQTISNPSQIATDITGSVTGVVGARYVILDYTPLEVISFTRAVAGTPIQYTWLANTAFLVITGPVFGVSDGDIMVTYRYAGGEPQPGQNYYMTAKYLRPASFYNQPILFLTKDDAKAFLAPSTTKNDLYIGSQICWEYPIQGLFVIQAKDMDDDGTLTKDDYKTAINAFLQDKRATDLVVLNYMAALPDQLQVVNRSSDPFENHECLTYIGAPIGTPIGSEQQVGTLVFLSRKTLAVFGQNPAHGTRILVAPTRATRTITLDDGSATVVTLDGSFVAAAVAALNASFTNPTNTILLQSITSFDSMQTYRQEENLVLGGAQLIYFKDEGSGVYRIYEDVTTDTFSPDTKNLNQMTQKQFVTRDIRQTINSSIIGLVFPSAGVGTSALQAILVSRLASLETNGFIGRYQSADGTERSIVPAADTVVFRDTVDPTLFHIGYNYFLATVAKRVFGLYTVNLPGGFPQ